MNEYWQKTCDYINARNQRERLIILLVVVALAFLLVDTIWLGSALDRRQQLHGRLDSIVLANRESSSQVEAINSAVAASAARQKNDKEALQARLSALDEKLASTASGFIPADLMPEVLETVLRQQSGVGLVALENIAPVVVNRNGEQVDAGVESEQLYRHGVTLKLSGGYLAMMEYLQKLEALPWYLDWRSMHYQVDEYPNGLLELEVYTYSTDKAWIGV